MGILSLCADSARPPGTTKILEDTDGSCITIGYKFSDERHCNMAPNLRVSDSHVTTYYSTQAAYPSSPRQQAPLPTYNWFKKQWLPPPRMKSNNSDTPCNWFNKQWLPPPRMKNDYSVTPPTYVDMNDQAQLPKSLARAPLWLPLTLLLLCFILMATFFTSWPRMKRKRKQIRTTRRRQQITWKYIYDSDRDKVLTWNNKRYVYTKRKNYNTFPRHAQPLQGHWHSSSFIADNQDNWTKITPKAIPDTRGTPQRRTDTDQNNLKMEAMDNKRHHHTTTLDTHTGKPQHSQASLTNKWNPISATKWKTTTATKTQDMTHSDNPKGKQHQQHKRWTRHIRTKQKGKPKLAANTLSRHPRKKGNDNPKDSKRSIKWHPQERFKIRWTKQHLDTYLALAEVSCEWNVDPG